MTTYVGTSALRAERLPRATKQIRPVSAGQQVTRDSDTQPRSRLPHWRQTLASHNAPFAPEECAVTEISIRWMSGKTITL
jgi:hypothetical protein